MFLVHDLSISNAAHFVVVAFLGGIQLVILGVIGEYIGRIFDEVKGRPDYVISEKMNIDS